MATKKQVRRRQKERRHEWEEVYVDSEGNVVDAPDEAESAPSAARGAKREQSKRTPTRGGRTAQPASWSRVGKRAAIFAPLMFLTVYVLAPSGSTIAQQLTQTALLLLVFIPFSYGMDVFMYRMWRRRTGQPDARGKQS